MAQAVGACWTGGFEEFVVNDENGENYTILYLPDRNNDQLQSEGKPPVYYWVPGEVRLAQFGDTGDYKFRHIHFVGILNEDTHIGVDGDSEEVAGGLLSFTTTARYPTAVLKQAEEQLLAKFRGDNDKYWGWRTSAAPMFRIAEIRSNTTAVSNLSPGSDGTAPAENIPRGASKSHRRLQSEARSLITPLDTQKRNRQPVASRGTLDAWAFELQGQGPGSVTGGENAYSGLLGRNPSELIWAGFEGGASPITVVQNMVMPMWSQELYLKIEGNWDRIFEHFSSAASGRYLWFSGDIKAEFNNLRIDGGITVEMAIDGTFPGGDKLQQEIDKRIDTIVQQFTDQAMKRIFEPAPPEVEPAKASSGGLFSKVLGIGGGLSLKYRRDSTKLKLKYEETRYHRYLQPNTISSSFRGFYNVIQNRPEEKNKYFQRFEMGSLSRKVRKVIKPVVNWKDVSKNWIGDPVAFLSAQIGYPTFNGDIAWRGHIFQSTDKDTNTSWVSDHVRKAVDEVAEPPAGWEPDAAFVRRIVHLEEPAGVTDNPFVVLDIEENVIELDPPGGTMITDSILEVRADAAGKLEVGPIMIDAVLADATQVVTVEFLAEGRKKDGSNRTPIRFQFNHDDQSESRYWEIYTGQLDYTARYRYRVHVTVRGSIFSPGMAWSGPWEEGQGNGPLMVRIPTPGAEGVVSRAISPREMSMGLPSSADSNESNQDHGAEELDYEPQNGAVPAPSGVKAPPMAKANGPMSRSEIMGYDLADTSSKSTPPC